MRRSTITFLSIFYILSFNLSGQNIDYDLKYGAKGAIQIEQQIGIYNDSLLTNYISNIGNKLVNQLSDQPFTYQFYILDTDEPNAFALPGGYVYVTRGLLPIANTEDELACVIAHEIIHSHRRHTIKQMKKSILPGILQLPGNIVGGPLGSMINSPISMGTQVWMANYSRKHEKESDKLGMEIAAKAGYDPKQLATILTNLSKLVEHKTGEEEKKNYLQGHPYTPERVEYIHDESTKLPVATLRKITEDSLFAYHLNGLIIGQNPSQGIVTQNILIHPDLKLYYQFPKEWNVVNTPEIIAGVQPNKEGAILLKKDVQHSKPEKAAEDFVRKLENKNVEILVDESKIINNNPAHMVAIKMQSNDQLVFLESVWIKKDTTLYNAIGYGYKKHMNEIQNSINSFRESSPSELQNLTYHSLKIINPKKGESIESLLKQNETEEFLDYSLIINNVENENLDLIKVVVKSSTN